MSGTRAINKQNAKSKKVVERATITKYIKKGCKDINKAKMNPKQITKGNLTEKHNSKIKECADKATDTKHNEKVCEQIEDKTHVNQADTRQMNKRKRRHSHKKRDNITTV